MSTRIVLVEDEEHLARGIQFNLELEGYSVRVVDDGSDAAAQLAVPGASGEADLVILDVMLPGLDGFAVVERMRQAGNFVPVLMVTARALPEDVVKGLERGADDYLPKPFDLAVLLARVKGLLRRRDWAREPDPERVPPLVRIGTAEVDFQAFEIRRGTERIPLTLLEAMLLKLLVQCAGRVVTKGEILDRVWNLSPHTQTRAVDNFVLRLRRYLGEDSRAPRYLHTIRGAGYRLDLD